jgi:hypothetical protein
MSRPRGPPGVGDTLLPILLVPLAYVCASLLPERYASVVVRSPFPHSRQGVGALTCYEVVGRHNSHRNVDMEGGGRLLIFRRRWCAWVWRC